jgi:hypothetical protein
VYLLKIRKRSVFYSGSERIADDNQFLQLNGAASLRLRYGCSKAEGQSNSNLTSPRAAWVHD